MKQTMCILFALLLVTAQTYGQDDAGQFDPSELDFYLQQSFAADSSLARHKLNHIGIRVQEDAEGYVVSAVLEGYPAHEAGLVRGDRLVAVNGEPFHPVYSFNKPEDAPADFTAISNEIELTLQRQGSTISLQLSPVYENLFDSYRTATLNSKLEFSAGNKVIGYVRFWGLSRSSSDLISYQRLLQELRHCDGIILDLRDSLGFLDVAHLDLAYQNRSSYLSISNPQTWLRNFTADQYPLAIDPYRKPIALLVNEGTMAGPELLAYQLAKLERIVSIGRTSAGRIGSFLPTANGEAYRYQPAEDTLIDGEPFEGRGLVPEQEIDYPTDSSGRIDPQYQTAVDILMGII